MGLLVQGALSLTSVGELLDIVAVKMFTRSVVEFVWLHFPMKIHWAGAKEAYHVIWENGNEFLGVYEICLLQVIARRQQ